MCFIKKQGYLNDDGEPQKDLIRESLSKTVLMGSDKLEKAIDECIVSDPALDKCENAYNV